MTWHLAPSLVQLRAEVDKTWPGRSKKSDGTIGNAAHSSRASDHNPNARGSVNAFDITSSGVDPQRIIDACKRHPACHYVIFNRSIYSSTHGWAKLPYSGVSPHTEHLHVSIHQSEWAEQDTTPWLTGATAGTKWPLSFGRRFGWRAGTRGPVKLFLVDKGPGVRRINVALLDSASSIYTARTADAVRAWQAKRGLPVTGIVGKREWERLGL